jgi:hypothetical protein
MTRLSILDNLRERSLGYHRMDEFNAPDFCTVRCAPTAAPLRPGLDANEQWALEATLSVTFWANRAQFPQVKEKAEKALVHRLYADILGDLAELQLQISNGNKMACHEIVHQIQSKLTR